MIFKPLTDRLIQFRPEKVLRFLVIFYVIGLAGFMIPFTREIFIQLTGAALVLNFVLILWFHEAAYKLDTYIVFIIIFLAGYFIEVIGVKSGMIFGSYAYGDALGLKIFDTPLMIGVNWLMLSYCFASVLQSLKLNKFSKILFASAGMVIYDLVMEQSAPMLDMWSWKDEIVPVENYLAWFIISLIFQLLLVFSGIRLKNRLAFVVLVCQFVFFFVLAIYKFFLS